MRPARRYGVGPLQTSSLLGTSRFRKYQFTGMILSRFLRSGTRSTWCSSAVNRASLSRRATSRTRSSALDAPDPALRPGGVLLAVFPLADPLSPPPPPPLPRLCSAGSQVLRDRPTSHPRTSQAYHEDRPEAPTPTRERLRLQGGGAQRGTWTASIAGGPSGGTEHLRSDTYGDMLQVRCGGRRSGRPVESSGRDGVLHGLGRHATCDE